MVGWTTFGSALAPVLLLLAGLLLAGVLYGATGLLGGSGFLAVFGGYGTWWLLSPVAVHVGSALVGVLFLVGHVSRHRVPRPRRTDLSRRRLLLGSGFLAGTAAVAVGGRR